MKKQHENKNIENKPIRKKSKIFRTNAKYIIKKT